MAAAHILDAPNQDAVEAFGRGQRHIREPRGIEVVARDVSGSLEDMLRELLPPTNVVMRRFLFVSTRSPWTAFFANGCPQSDVETMMSGSTWAIRGPLWSMWPQNGLNAQPNLIIDR